MHRTAGRIALVAATASALLLPSPAFARGSGYTTDCPPAENLVTGTVWHSRTVAAGVGLHEATRQDREGQVRIHELRVGLTTKGVSVHPIAGHLATRVPLSTLARGRKRLVAATNAGFFDFRVGAPTGRPPCR